MRGIFLFLPFFALIFNILLISSLKSHFFTTIQGVKIYLFEGKVEAFAFFNRVYISYSLISHFSDLGLKGVLAHELAHAKRHHSFISFLYLCLSGLVGYLFGFFSLLILIFFGLLLYSLLELDADLYASKLVGVDPLKAYLLERKRGFDVYHPPTSLRMKFLISLRQKTSKNIKIRQSASKYNNLKINSL